MNRGLAVLLCLSLLGGCTAAPPSPPTIAPLPTQTTPSSALPTATNPPDTILTATIVAPISPPTIPATVSPIPILPTKVLTTSIPAIGVRTKTTGCVAKGPLPDSACTPGAIFVTVLAGQVCESGYAKSVRSVSTAEKNAVYTEYGITSRSTGQYEVDHLISLELGGTNDIANLWPEAASPKPGFHEKDQVENELHARVCSGFARLADVQREVATNWLELYNGGTAAPASTPGDSALDVADATPTLLPMPVQTTATTESAAPAPAAGLSFTSVVGGPPGGKASVTVQTSPGAACSISYHTPSGTNSTAQGLVPVTANASGSASWIWSIGPSTKPGAGKVAVTCNGTTITSPITIG